MAREKINNMFSKVKEILKKNFVFIKQNSYNIITNPIKNSFNRCLDGEEGFTFMLFIWCIIPNLLFVSKIFNIFYQFMIIKILIIFYIIFCFYIISLAVDKHPEYNPTELEAEKEREYILTLSDEELKNYKKGKLKEGGKDFIKKALLQKPWKAIEFYNTVQTFLAFMLVLTMKNMLI